MTKSMVSSLDENLLLDKIFKKCYLVYAFWFVLIPILSTIFNFIGLNFLLQTMIVSCLFMLTKVFELIFNFKKISIKNKTIIDLLLLCFALWFLVCSFASSAINVNFFYGICWLMLFILFFELDKKYYKILAIVFVAEMTLNSILGLIDLKNEFIFNYLNDRYYPMTMQFENPNWAGFVVILSAVICLYLLFSSEKKCQKVLYYISYAILAFGLFAGGSYAPEVSLFFCEFALILYFWIKRKKCPWLLVSVFLVTIFFSFAVWWIPVLRPTRTASQNFFYESLAVIDWKLGTNFLEGISSFIAKILGEKGGSAITEVPGSDGWGRVNLDKMAMDAVLASPKAFIFGYGAGYIYQIRVHNCFMVIWLEFGIIGLLLYLSIIAMLLVRFIKVKKSDKIIFLFFCFAMMLFESMYCCIEPYCYLFLVMFGGVVYRELYSAELKNKKPKVQENLAQK